MAGVSRLGDLSTTDPCGAPPRTSSSASPDVFTNGIKTHRQTDSWEPHSCPSSAPHDAVTVSGSSAVFVNGKQISRIGDPISCGSTIAQGSSNVFSG